MGVAGQESVLRFKPEAFPPKGYQGGETKHVGTTVAETTLLLKDLSSLKLTLHKFETDKNNIAWRGGGVTQAGGEIPGHPTSE
jgi:hypothetical protein